MKIRKAELKDIVTLALVAKQAFYEAFADDPRNSPEEAAFSVERMTEELKDENVHFFLVENEGEIVGYAQLKRWAKAECVSAEKPIKLCRLYLLQKYIGKGYGATLMRHCLDFAVRNGHDVMWLGVWEYNYRAQKFYEKFGFERVGEEIFQLGNDPQTDWILQKKLSSSADGTLIEQD